MEKLQPFPFQQTREEENMKKLVSALLALTMTTTMIAPAFAEQNKAQKNAELYKQEKFYAKDFRSYAEDAFDLTALPDYDAAANDVSGWLEIWGQSALATGRLARLWADGSVTLPPESMADMAEESVGVKKAETFQQAIDEFAKTYPPTIYAEKITLPES